MGLGEAISQKAPLYCHICTSITALCTYFVILRLRVYVADILQLQGRQSLCLSLRPQVQ